LYFASNSLAAISSKAQGCPEVPAPVAARREQPVRGDRSNSPAAIAPEEQWSLRQWRVR
jgi:hypothetical protein